MINKRALFACNTRAAIDIYWVAAYPESKVRKTGCIDIEHGIRYISVYNRKAHAMDSDWEYGT